MAKNRFAQPLYGKIIYIFETDLKMEELSTIFSPKTYWIDVTGIDCEVGYIQEFREGEGVVWVAPPNEERTFEQEKAAMLEKVDAWTASKITGGFDSKVTGAVVRYDSDKDTQITMQGIALNVNTELFAEKYPAGCPVRGYAYAEVTDEAGNAYPVPSSEKSIFMLTAEQVLQWCADLSMHIGNCKQAGWMKQAEVQACTTKEELDAIVLD
jgi:hypothetical protein